MKNFSKKIFLSQLLDLVLAVEKRYYIDIFHGSQHRENRDTKLAIIDITPPQTKNLTFYWIDILKIGRTVDISRHEAVFDRKSELSGGGLKYAIW